MNATTEGPKPPANPQDVAHGELDGELKFLMKEGGPSGRYYDLYVGRISQNPVVRSHTTGKYFMLPWSAIIELAVKNGLDEK